MAGGAEHDRGLDGGHRRSPAQVAPRSISYALGSKTGAPHGVKTAVTVPAGHRIDELAVAPRGGGATAAWVESWFDKGSTYHSIVRAMDIAPHAMVRDLSPAGRLASGLSFAGDVAGDQVIAWQSCTAQAACQAQADGRGATGSFGAVRTLGAIDPSQEPAAAVGAHGQVLVGWVGAGKPVAATAASAGGRFGAPATLSSTTFALDLTVAFGPVAPGWRRGRRARSTRAWSAPPTPAEAAASVAGECRARAPRAPAARPCRPPAPWLGNSAPTTTFGWPTGA